MSLVLLAFMIATVLAVQLLLATRQRRGHAAASLVGQAARAPLPPPIAPPGTFIAPTHSWLRFAADGTLKLGIDDLVAGVLGTIDALTLPEVGSRVDRGDPLVGLRIGDVRLAVPAPAAGEVVARNELALTRPERVGDDPYGLGWLLRLQPDDHKQALEPLYIGRGANGFLRREYRRLVELVAAASSPEVVHLADGGMLERGALAALQPAALAAFEREFLREGP